MREWVPCTDLLKGDASEAGATFCTRDSVKVNLRSVFWVRGGDRRVRGKERGVGMESGVETFERGKE